MEEIKVIKKSVFLGKEIDVYGTAEEPLFKAKDVAEWIEHSDVSTMMRTVDEDEKVTNNVCTPGGNQDMWFLTEDGLYEVLMQSRKPIAKQFKKGVKTILKEIRRTGSFSSTAVLPQPNIQEQVTAKIAFADWSAKFLNLNEASKLGIAQRIGKIVGLDDALPQAINAGTEHPVTLTATELLHRHGITMSALAFNRILERKGVVRRASRPSRVKGKTHNWMVLQPAFSRYGENQQDPSHQQQTQIRWYEALFADILSIAGITTQPTLSV